MFAANHKKIILTLVIYSALLFIVVLPSQAKASAHRDHVNLHRMIKQRSPQNKNAVDLPTQNTPPTNGSLASASAITTTSTSVQSSSLPIPITSASASKSQSSTSSSSSFSTSQSSSSSSSSSSSLSSSLSSSTFATTTTAPPSVDTPPPIVDSNTTVPPPPKATVTKTSSVAADAASTSPPAAQKAAASVKSTTLTVIIIIASSVGGVVILWTIFRKWKLARSSKFDERLQPIDWQPTNVDEGITPAHRRVTSDTSFKSGSIHSNTAGRGAVGYGSDDGHGSSIHSVQNNSDHGHGTRPLGPLPDHDFTPGAALAPVGGYADLARGPSPQPRMYELSRGPSVTRPAYDFGVPLHHQTGYTKHDGHNYNGSTMRY